MRRLRTGKLAAWLALGGLALATLLSVWHLHLPFNPADDNRSRPASAKALTCPACTLSHQQAPAPKIHKAEQHVWESSMAALWVSAFPTASSFEYLPTPRAPPSLAAYQA